MRGVLAVVRVPVLLLHRSGDRLAGVRAGRYLSERLAEATSRDLPGEDHLPFSVTRTRSSRSPRSS